MTTAALLTAQPLKAQQSVLPIACFPQNIKEVTDALERSAGEHVVGQGITNSGKGIIQILANPETGSWTILGYSLERQMTCYISDGESWQHVTPVRGSAL